MVIFYDLFAEMASGDQGAKWKKIQSAPATVEYE